MRQWLRQGWQLTVRHKYALVLLFLYRLLWGYFVYRFVDSIVSPVLARFPSQHPNDMAASLFLIEAQFRLVKTDAIRETLWLLGTILALRMVLTPLLNAGLFYSFHHANEQGGTKMMAGMKRAWKPMALLYVLENALLLLPGVWLVPLAIDRFGTSASLSGWLQELLPYAALWIGWGFALRVLFPCLQFGAVSREGIGRSLLRAARGALPLAGVTLSLIGAGLAASAAISALSLLWSGFAIVALNQAFHFVRALLSLWTSASQYEVWRGME